MSEKQTKKLPPAVVKLFPGYEVFKMPWGAATKNLKTGNWDMAFFSDGQELSLENWEVELHDNGIEILGFYGKVIKNGSD